MAPGALINEGSVDGVSGPPRDPQPSPVMGVDTRARLAELWCAGPTEPGEGPTLQPLPRWARFMAVLGGALAGAGDEPVTVAISVPTRDYAAALAGTAAVLRRDELAPMAPDDLGMHLATLRDTPCGTPVKYLGPKQKVYDGRWVGIVAAPTGSGELLAFELARGETRKLPLDRALSIHLTGETTDAGQLRAKQIAAPCLLCAIRGDRAAVTYVTTARCDVLTVGTLSLLERELTGERFTAHDAATGASAGGVLQDLARARQLPSAGRFFRSALVPSASSPTPEVQSLRPSVVVYDGGRAYLRLRHAWPSAHKLVILDRSAPSSDEAAAELAEAFAYRSAGADVLGLVRVPPGIEALAFRGPA